MNTLSTKAFTCPHAAERYVRSLEASGLEPAVLTSETGEIVVWWRAPAARESAVITVGGAIVTSLALGLIAIVHLGAWVGTP